MIVTQLIEFDFCYTRTINNDLIYRNQTLRLLVFQLVGLRSFKQTLMVKI